MFFFFVWKWFVSLWHLAKKGQRRVSSSVGLSLDGVRVRVPYLIVVAPAGRNASLPTRMQQSTGSKIWEIMLFGDFQEQRTNRHPTVWRTQNSSCIERNQKTEPAVSKWHCYSLIHCHGHASCFLQSIDDLQLKWLLFMTLWMVPQTQRFRAAFQQPPKNKFQYLSSPHNCQEGFLCTCIAQWRNCADKVNDCYDPVACTREGISCLVNGVLQGQWCMHSWMIQDGTKVMLFSQNYFFPQVKKFPDKWLVVAVGSKLPQYIPQSLKHPWIKTTEGTEPPPRA